MMPITKTEAKIINYLYGHCDEGRYAAEIAREVGIVKRTIYDSLDSLEEKGLIRKQNRGRMRFYTLDNKGMDIAEAAKLVTAETDEARTSRLSEREERVKELEQRATEISQNISSFLEEGFALEILDKDEAEILKKTAETLSKKRRKKNKNGQ